MTTQITYLNKILEAKSKAEGSELEICVSCNGETNIRKDAHIDERPNYVDGVGQFCAPCYEDKIISTKQFAEALEKNRYKIK